MAERIVGQTPTTTTPNLLSLAQGGVKVERSTWFDDYTGSKEALIAAGIVGDGQFPGDPGRGSTSVSYSRHGISTGAGKKAALQILRQGKKFRVRIRVDIAESNRRWDAEDALERVKEAEAKAGEPEAELFAEQREGEKNYCDRLFLQSAFDFGPMDEAGARAAVIEHTERNLACANAFAVRAGGSFFTGPFSVRLTEEEREELDDAIETIRRLAHYGQLVRDSALSGRIARYRDAKAARENKPLQSFLAALEHTEGRHT